MSLLSTLTFVNQYAATGAPGVPPEVQQVASQLNHQLCNLFTQLTHYLLLGTGLLAVFALLTGSLLFLLHRPLRQALILGIRPDQVTKTRWGVPAHRRPKHALESRIARSNWQALQSAATRMKAGQLSN